MLQDKKKTQNLSSRQRIMFKDHQNTPAYFSYEITVFLSIHLSFKFKIKFIELFIFY